MVNCSLWVKRYPKRGDGEHSSVPSSPSLFTTLEVCVRLMLTTTRERVCQQTIIAVVCVTEILQSQILLSLLRQKSRCLRWVHCSGKRCRNWLRSGTSAFALAPCPPPEMDGCGFLESARGSVSARCEQLTQEGSEKKIKNNSNNNLA